MADESDCAKRYLCEISAAPAGSLTDRDQATLGLFTQTPPSPARKVFDAAWHLGSGPAGAAACRGRYSRWGPDIVLDCILYNPGAELRISLTLLVAASTPEPAVLHYLVLFFWQFRLSEVVLIVMVC